MRLPKNFIDALGCTELLIHLRGITFISKRKLIFQVNKFVIDRCSRKHQDLGFHAGTDDPVHQLQITVFPCIFPRHFPAIAEIMALINYHKIVISPIQTVQVNTVGLSMFTGKVRVVEDIIAQPVSRNRVINVVAFICIPVLRELFGTKDKHRFVAVLIILDHRKGRKCFAQAYAVRQNTAIELLQLADNGKDGISLEIVKHSPNFAVFEPSRFIRQFIF